MSYLLRLLLCLMIFSQLFACDARSTQHHSVQIPIQAFYQGQIIDCGQLTALGLTDLRFYLFVDTADPKAASDMQLVELVAPGKACIGAVKATLDIALQSEGGQNLSALIIGVPSELNHQNPAQAEYPLNQSTMHWQWLSGYKFMRLEYAATEQLNRFHLGSWGCSGKLPDQVECQEKNNVRLEMNTFMPGHSQLEMHLDPLLNVRSASLCMGDPAEPACRDWLLALRTNVFSIGSVQ